MTDDLVAFLWARFDVDEQAARESGQPSLSWKNFDMDGELRDDCNAGTVAYVPRDDTRTYISRFDPVRVLAEVAAKRAIVHLHRAIMAPGWCSTCDVPGDVKGNEHGCQTLRLLAAPYADHEDYRPEWAPDA